jgi:hypothetical protein
MAATATNNIWEKVELALKRYILSNSIGLNEANIYCGHANDWKASPSAVCECHDWEPETSGRNTGNWICRATVTVKTKLSDETGVDNSGRFASITDAFLQRGAADGLTSAEEFFTCFLCLPGPGNKRIQGDELVVEQSLTLHCCGSVIS